MGKVITKRIQGMSLWAKISLVTTLTLFASVFMYQGWYLPMKAQAAPVTYYVNIDTATGLTADGTCNVTGLTPYTSTGIGKTTTIGADSGTSYRYYPTTTAGGTATALNVYTPVYASNAVDISAISASAALRGLAATDTVKLDLYDYDPAGAANNGTLVASSPAITLTGGVTTTQYTWAAGNFTLNGTGRVAQGHRLQFRFTWFSTIAGTPRVYFGATGALTSTNFTVTETAAIINPTVTSASPLSQNQGTGPTTVTITGTGFKTGATVTFSGTGVTAGASTFGSATSITVPVTVTAGAATGARTITVTNTDTGVGTGGSFTVNPAAIVNPTVTSASPLSQNQGTGPTTVTITGTGFKTGATVTFSGTGVTAGASTFGSATSITVPVTVTAGAATGARTITVTNTDTGVGTGGAFTVNAAAIVNPTVTSASPLSQNQGTGPTTVTITGTGFKTGATVTFSGTGVTAGASTFGSATSITVPVTVTAGAATGARTITVTNTDTGVGTGGTFTVNASGTTPTITSVTPNTRVQGSAAATVTIVGTNLTGGAVTFSNPGVTGGAATVTATQITLPVTVTAGATVGAGTVTVTTAGGSANSAFTVTSSSVVNPLMHNSANLGTAKGTWGTNFTCATCHSGTTTNIKRIALQVSTPQGLRPVTFTRMTANPVSGNASTGVFGNDARTYNTITSNNICSVCHHKTTHHQYSTTSTYAGYTKTHNNNKDCTACHQHSAGFAASGACDACHGNPPGVAGGTIVTSLATGAPGVGAHVVHNTRNITCDACHNGTGMPTTDKIMAIGFNVNGTTFPGFPGSVAFGTFSAPTMLNGYTFTAGNAGTRVSMTAGKLYSCNVYCHGNWPGSNGSKNAAWNGGATEAACGTCHGTTAAQAPTSNAHSRHAANGVEQYQKGCANCHGTLPANNTHVNGTVLVALTNGTYSRATGIANPTAANGTCSATYCHSDGTNLVTPPANTTVAWNASGRLTCGSCHGNPPSYTTGKVNSHIQHVTTGGYTCDLCHVKTTTNGTSIVSVARHTDKFYNVSANKTKLTVTPFIYTAAGTTCSVSQCHTSVMVWGANTTGNDTCTKCHGTLTAGTATDLQKAPTVPATAAHAAHMATPNTSIAKTVACNECHEAVLTAATPGHMDGSKTIQFRGAVGASNGVVVTETLAGCSTTWCHGGNTTLLPPNKGTQLRTTPVWGTTFGTTSVLGDALGVASVNTGTGRCAKCHGFPPATDNHIGAALTGANGCFNCHVDVSTNGISFVNLSMHIDGNIDATGSCTGCHDTGKSGNVNGRREITPQFDTAGNSHHVQTTTNVQNTACYACHWEANSDGSKNNTYHNVGSGVALHKVQLVIWGTSTTRPATQAAGNYVLYSSGRQTNSTRVEMAKINNHCLGCHNDANKTTTPFGDGRNPNDYAWDATSVDARYSNTGTTAWGKFSGNDTNNKSTQTKSFSAHGRATANPRGWSTVVDTYPSATASSNVLCFDCHNSHGSSASASAGITSSYSSATGRRKGGILKDTIINKGGYSLTYKPAAAGSSATKNIYNAGGALCFDCHNTATASATRPWGYTGTYGFTPPTGQLAGTGILGYHDTPYFGSVGGTFIATMDYAYKAGKSVNMGGHFGASSALTTAITKRSFDPGTPSGTVIQGQCTPCHDPHGVSPSLTTGQAYAVPLLKGTWVTSPYKQDATPANTNEVRGGGSGTSAFSVSSTPLYQLDQRAFQAAITGKPASARSWNFATAATTLQTTNETQFAGLCVGCHAKTALRASAASSTANWKSVGRIHNSVNGWASTGGGNAGNSRHAYTCSKCHTPHNSRLPRLAVTNCLDVKHRGRVASGGNMSAAQSFSGTSGAGIGRFPGGGGGTNTNSRATNPGPWFFGTAGRPGATPACHASATAGGATFSTGAELWNTKTPW